MADPSGIHTNNQEQLLRRVDDLARRCRELERDLERSHRLAMLGTLAGTIAHEFNNLLTPMMSYAQLALSDPDDRALVTKALTKAVDTTEKAAQISSSLLGFIRDDGAAADADVESVIHEAIACAARSPEKDGIRVRVVVEPGCRAAMRPVALQQVLLNLILNARQAMSPGGGELDIVAECSTLNTAPGVEITVRDTGAGIPPGVMERIFEPFNTGHGGGGGEAGMGGTGLGLSICKRLVDEAGGGIEVHSTEGQGTCFTLYLPAPEAARGTEQIAA